MCGWVTLPCNGKLTEHCKSAIMERIKIKKNKLGIKKQNKTKKKCVQNTGIFNLKKHAKYYYIIRYNSK